MIRRTPKNESGYVMTTVIFLIIIMSIVAYAALLQANNGLTLAYRQSYIQMARVASKAAVDYAQEQFDKAPCGAYTGTDETDLVVNNRYRLTFRAEVTDTSGDGLEKTIKGTGSVYLPKLSTTAKYVFDIRSEIVRTFAACKTPDNFAPLVWLDASDLDTLKSVGTSTTTANPLTSYGSSADSTRDTLEERADNGGQTAGSWQSNDFEMHTCDSTEFTNTICTTNSSRYLNIGMIYSNVAVPKNATITTASLTLACTTPAGASGSLTNRIYGIYKSATDPHPDLFTQSGTNQLRTPLATSSLHTVAYSSTSSNNCPPGNNTVFNVTNVIQEIVNNPNWNPATGGGRLGLAIQRQSGSGSRHFLKSGNQLSISYSTTTVTPAPNNGGVGIWNDKSGNGNNAVSTYGNIPTRVDGQINGLTVVRFNNGTMLSSLTTALTNKREFTVLAVVKSNFGTSSNDGRIITGMSSAASNDTTANTGIIPLLRHASANGFSNLYSGSATANRTDYTCGGICASLPYLYTSIFDINDTNTIDSTLKGNGAPVATKPGLAPSGSPYTFSIDQLYIGGRRNGTGGAAVGTSYFNGDFAEIIVYDKVLDCREVEALEEYLRSKWAVSGSEYPTTCPADVIPTL